MENPLPYPWDDLAVAYNKAAAELKVAEDAELAAEKVYDAATDVANVATQKVIAARDALLAAIKAAVLTPGPVDPPPVEPPPTQPLYGPRVELKTGPQQSYKVPTGPGVVQLTPTTDLQAAINASPEGTVFVFAPGTYVLPGVGNDWGLRPKSRQEFHGSFGTILTRNGSRGKAFIANAGARNVVLANLIIQDMVQGNTAETAAVTTLEAPGAYNSQPGGPSRTRGCGWVIRNCKITRCSAGIHAGTDTLVEDCDASDCYGVGIKTWGDFVTIRRCRANRVNMVQEPGKPIVMPWGGSYDAGYEAGGIKCWKGAGVVVEDCETDGNGGAGTWSDYGNAIALDGADVPRIFQHIRAVGNKSSGVAIEMSDGAKVRNCFVTLNEDWTKDGRKALDGDWNNGGIGVYDSPYALIADNYVVNNQGGITLQTRPRGPIAWLATPEVQSSEPGTASNCRHALVTRNIIEWHQGVTGVRQIPTDDFPPYTKHEWPEVKPDYEGVQWIGNTYKTDVALPFIAPAETRTVWDHDRLTLEQWNAGGPGR